MAKPKPIGEVQRSPKRNTAQQGRKGQNSAPHTGGTYTDLSTARGAFRESADKQRGMTTIPATPSTARNGGTQQYKQNKGRQKPL